MGAFVFKDISLVGRIIEMEGELNKMKEEFVKGDLKEQVRALIPNEIVTKIEWDTSSEFDDEGGTHLSICGISVYGPDDEMLDIDEDSDIYDSLYDLLGAWSKELEILDDTYYEYEEQ